ncbi:MAG TPA: GNAT family N-acetyltransferase [Bryobacteraceae bacterium]|nr:GNAT family N-acetyltransferase [Bryobacteraceae bacterium]
MAGEVPGESCLGLQASNNGTWWAHVDGVNAGTASVSDDNDHIVSVVVEPEYRRQGIATALHDRIEKDLGHKLNPSPTYQSAAAKAFWKSRRQTESLREAPSATPGSDSPTAKKAQKQIATAGANALQLAGRATADAIAANYVAAGSADAAMDYVDLEPLDSWAQPFAEAIKPVLVESGQRALVNLNINDQNLFDLVNNDARDYARDRGAELVGRKWVDGKLVDNPDSRWAITDSTRKGIRDLLVESYEKGLTPADVKKELLASDLFSPARAEMIARTETAMASVAGNLNGWRRSGVVQKKAVLLSNDHRDGEGCECEDAVAAGPIPLDDPFPNGSDGPPFHPNCNCSIYAVFADEPAESLREGSAAAAKAWDTRGRKGDSTSAIATEFGYRAGHNGSWIHPDTGDRIQKTASGWMHYDANGTLTSTGSTGASLRGHLSHIHQLTLWNAYREAGFLETSAGARKAWDTRGRGRHAAAKPGPKLAERKDLAVKSLKPVKSKAWNGGIIDISSALSKQETGKLAENIIVAYLKSQGLGDAQHINTTQANYPVDLMQDHKLIEAKGGLVSNGKSAQQWRCTEGEPGPKEKQWLAQADPDEKRAHNLEKQQAIIERKQQALDRASKALGRKLTGHTYATIINPDTKTADIYHFPGFHLRIGWNSPQAQRGYVATVKYA